MIITDMCEIQAPEPASKSPVPFSASWFSPLVFSLWSIPRNQMEYMP
jgi:hypothetical protein